MSLSNAKLPSLSDKLEPNGKVKSEDLSTELEALEEELSTEKKPKIKRNK